MVQVLLDPVMGMVDTAIVGRLGTEALAGVGLSTIIFNFSSFIWWVAALELGLPWRGLSQPICIGRIDACLPRVHTVSL